MAKYQVGETVQLVDGGTAIITKIKAKSDIVRYVVKCEDNTKIFLHEKNIQAKEHRCKECYDNGFVYTLPVKDTSICPVCKKNS